VSINGRRQALADPMAGAPHWVASTLGAQPSPERKRDATTRMRGMKTDWRQIDVDALVPAAEPPPVPSGLRLRVTCRIPRSLWLDSIAHGERSERQPEGIEHREWLAGAVGRG